MIESANILPAVKQAEMEQYTVTCGVTGKSIPLNEVLYWNVERQIPYIGPEVIPKDHFYQDIVPQALETTKDQT